MGSGTKIAAAALMVVTGAYAFAGTPPKKGESDAQEPGRAPADINQSMELVEVKVRADNDEWTETGLVLKEGDLLLLRAFGSVKAPCGYSMCDLGPWGFVHNVNSIRPEEVLRRITSGSLLAKIGPRTHKPGPEWIMATMGEQGPVKLKVHVEKHRTKSSGEFSVQLIKIPKEIRPAFHAQAVATD